MKKQIKRKIYLLSKRDLKPIEVIQFETGVQLIFEVQDLELDTTATATLFVRKPSGKFVLQKDNISLTGNTVVIDLHNQAITEYGKPFFQIKFKKDEEVISTYSGMITVEKSLDDAGAEESKTVIAAFDTFTDAEIARIEEATQAQIELMKAEVEAKGESVLATIPEDYTEMYNRVNSLFNSVANAIKGTVSGPVVRIDDVSPVEHSPVVKVHGKNLFNGELIAGVYFTEDFATDSVDGLIFKSVKVFLTPGTYTLSFGKKVNIVRSIIDGVIAIVGYIGITELTFTVTTAGYVGFTFRDSTSITTEWDNTINIQVEEGDTATEYTPYIDPTTVTVTRCGKNLFNLRNIEPTSPGSIAYISEVGDNYIIIPGTSNTYCDTRKKLVDICPNIKASETYTLSGITDSVNNYIYLGGNVKQSWRYGYAKLVTEEMLTAPVVIYGSENKDCKISNIQLELGETATDYEAYKEATEHTPSSDGTIDGLTSISPTMTILTDKEGVTIECEYNKDTNKVLEKLTNAVAALGGAV